MSLRDKISSLLGVHNSYTIKTNPLVKGEGSLGPLGTSQLLETPKQSHLLKCFLEKKKKSWGTSLSALSQKLQPNDHLKLLISNAESYSTVKMGVFAKKLAQYLKILLNFSHFIFLF